MQKVFFLIIALGTCWLAGCSSDADLPPAERYAKDLAAAREATATSNDFYLGLEIGISRKEYYDRCTVLNREQKITMGAGGNTVNHNFQVGLDRPATMTFAPEFTEDRKTVTAFTVLLSYVDWSPWNTKSHADQLLRDVYPFLTKTYGEFYAVPHERVGRVLVNFSNNRRISAWLKDERYVQMRFTDLRALPEEELAYRTNAY